MLQYVAGLCTFSLHVDDNILCFCIHPSAGTTSQVVEFPHDQTVPLNSVARFTCRTARSVVWQIGNGQLFPDSPSAVDAFAMQGIRVDNENVSVLLVNASLSNNRTSILCRAGPDPRHLNESRTAVLTVFGEYRIVLNSCQLIYTFLFIV